MKKTLGDPGETEPAGHAAALNLDAVHDAVHEMAGRGKVFSGVPERYIGK